MNNIEQLRMINKYPLYMVGENYYLSVQIIAGMIDNRSIRNRATFSAYEMYKKLCVMYEVDGMSNIAFSKFIIFNFQYKIINKKAYRKKFRVFVEG